MGATERIVRHLRLRAESEASVRRAALNLEDALRCASLPDAGARLLLVRRLDLGRVAAGASAQTLSLLLERRVAAVGGTWVHGAEANAEPADFVFFRDALEARCELALRLARAAPCTAWYWPLAVPEYKREEDVQANLRHIALAIAALPEAPAALPAWTAHLTGAGVAAVLAQAVGPVEAALLLRAARLSVDAPRLRSIRMAPSALPPLAGGAQDVDYAEPSPPRTLAPAFLALPAWVRTLAGAGGFVPSVSSTMPAAACAASTDASVGPSQAGSEQTFEKQYSDAESPSAFVLPDTRAKNVHDSFMFKQIDADIAPLPAQRDNIPTEAAPEPSRGNRPAPNAAASEFGGLLFLLPVMQRLGYAAWTESLTEGAAKHVAQKILALVLRRLRAPPEDPAWLLAGRSSDDDLGNIDIKAPASWRDSALAAPRGGATKDIVAMAEQVQPAAVLAHTWLIACRRWLRRVAGIGVAGLVVRPAAIGLTATHADIIFRLSNVDMRVRRTGLDFDPGWVPWYGRVVNFHYDREEVS
ncbi:MAG: hypothetical protein IH606_02710 [Burkholderiales bacterium]|nr:hypothetical protein [Burkholderiales bacterium]